MKISQSNLNFNSRFIIQGRKEDNDAVRSFMKKQTDPIEAFRMSYVKDGEVHCSDIYATCEDAKHLKEAKKRKLYTCT